MSSFLNQQVKRIIEEDPRYKAVESSKEREDLFDEYIQSISKEYQRHKRYLR